MREVTAEDSKLRVWEADEEDYDEEKENTIFPAGMTNIAGFNYGDSEWDSLVHVLERINADLGENRYGMVDQPYSESVFVVKIGEGL